MSAFSNYILVSPVKNEAQYVDKTIQAVLNQTLKPSRWVIVDDGSSDATRSIAEKYARQFHWITVVSKNGDATGGPGTA